MKALILLSHGSRRRQSNEEMQALAAQVARFDSTPFDEVVACFQQFAAPSFEQAVQALVGRGVTEAVVLPLFLASGNHVLEDVPAMVAAARSRHPELTLTVRPHLGQCAGFARFLLDQAAV